MFYSSNLFEKIDYIFVYKKSNINKNFYQNFLFLYLFIESYEQQFSLFLMKK